MNGLDVTQFRWRFTRFFEVGLACATAALGAWVAGSGAADATAQAWLAGGAFVGVVGAVLVAVQAPRPPSGWLSLGLALAVVSPTVFFYPLNVVLMVMSVGELWAWRHARQR